ncbi:hypothetical protein GCM10028808_57770 [Spirosoma migulaei]
MSDKLTANENRQFWGPIIVAIIAGAFGLAGTLFGIYAKTEEKQADKERAVEKKGRVSVQNDYEALKLKYDSLLRACGKVPLRQKDSSSATLPSSECVIRNYAHGKIRFKNNLSQDLVLYRITGPTFRSGIKIMIAAGAEAESPLLSVGPAATSTSHEYYFFFSTTEEEAYKNRKGEMIIQVKGCEVIEKEINSKTLFLSH